MEGHLEACSGHLRTLCGPMVEGTNESVDTMVINNRVRLLCERMSQWKVYETLNTWWIGSCGLESTDE